MQKIFVIIVLLVCGFAGFGQNPNPAIRQGNKDFRQEKYNEAEMKYRRALLHDTQNTKALYNLANSLYKQGRYEDAIEILEGLSQMNINEGLKADAFHNLGNARMGAQQIAEGVEAYKNALRLRPQDQDTRHNLVYALRMLQQQEQQQQDGSNDQDKKDQQKDKEQPQQEDPSEKQQNQQQKPRPDQISPQDAQRILDALNQKEQKVQEKIEREKRQAAPRRVEREW